MIEGTSSSELLGVPPGSSEGSTRTGLLAAAVALFFLLRLALLVVREPFFDELFTVWMAGKELDEILPALFHDSGPPLYYSIASIQNVTALRFLSLLFATVTFAMVIRRSVVAALLLAVYPPAVLFAVDARAYALCGLFITLAVLAWLDEKPWVCALAILLAAYTHWYGALFFPLLLVGRPAGPPESGLPARRGAWVAAALTAGVLFIPGVLLAMRQPPAAMAWLGERAPWDALWALSFVREYPASLFAPVPLWVAVVAAVGTLLVLMGRVGPIRQMGPMGQMGPMRPIGPMGLWVMLPVLAAIALALTTRPVYFAMRFESVIAVPLVLWLAQRPNKLAIALAALGVAATVYGAVDHARRPLDSHRQAATILRENIKAREQVVATGYLYLQAIHQLGEHRVTAYPAEQATHPGWRAIPRAEPLPKTSFIWIAERQAPELAALRREGRRARLLYQNDRALILRVE